MSGNTGPQGPRGPEGPEGPSGITGQKGTQGIRGFPGKPCYPISLQILQSSNTSGSNVSGTGPYKVIRKFETGIPSISAGPSSNIIGLSNDSTTGYITFPSGQYYIEASANLNNDVSISSNVTMRFMQSNTGGDTTVLFASASGSFSRSIYLQGPLTIPTGSTGSFYFGQFFNANPATCNIAPVYNSNYYGATGPSFTPPNISVAIMKLV
jgi:hypothetical protein